jgi:DNA polymerase-1
MTVIGQNFINYDMPWLESYGMVFSKPIYDTMIAQHVISPGLPKVLKPLSLQFLCSIYTNEPYYKDEGKEIKGKLPPDKQYGEYNCKDVFNSLEIALKQVQHKDFKNRIKVFKFETKLAQITLHNISERGVLIDEPYRVECKKRVELECEYLKLKVSESIGEKINIASPQQVAKLLYEKLKLKPIYKKDTKGQKVVTTDESALKLLKVNYSKYRIKELDLILKFREAEQLRKGILSTEIDRDNRIRSTFKQDEDTGRLSGGPSPFWTGQSLGVIPRDAKIRKMFLPDLDVWIHRDLSQAEAWLTYYEAGANDMLEKMTDGLKPHQLMASIIGGKGYNESGKGTKEYTLGKKVVHASNYLIGPRTLAGSIKKELGINVSQGQAKQYINAYYRLVPEVSIWHLKILNELKENRMILRTAFGRERKFFGHFDGTLKGSIALMQKAVAYKPQSTIGDLLVRILLKWEELKTVGKLILPNHDEGNFDCRWVDLATCLKELNEAFNYSFNVGKYKNIVIPWDTSIQKNWGECYSEEEIGANR